MRRATQKIFRDKKTQLTIMPKPLALIFLFAWLTLLAAGLQWGFTNNWTDFNWLIYLTTILGLITLAAAALKPKN